GPTRAGCVAATQRLGSGLAIADCCHGAVERTRHRLVPFAWTSRGLDQGARPARDPCAPVGSDHAEREGERRNAVPAERPSGTVPNPAVQRGQRPERGAERNGGTQQDDPRREEVVATWTRRSQGCCSWSPPPCSRRNVRTPMAHPAELRRRRPSAAWWRSAG